MRVLRRQDRRQVLVLDLARGARRGAPASTVRRSDGEHRLADVLDERRRRGSDRRATIGPQSFSPGMSAAVSTATTPGAARTAGEIDRPDPRVRAARAEPERRVQRAARSRGCRRCRAPRRATCRCALSWRNRRRRRRRARWPGFVRGGRRSSCGDRERRCVGRRQRARGLEEEPVQQIAARRSCDRRRSRACR